MAWRLKTYTALEAAREEMQKAAENKSVTWFRAKGAISEARLAEEAWVAAVRKVDEEEAKAAVVVASI